jgi:hypothetical protein
MKKTTPFLAFVCIAFVLSGFTIWYSIRSVTRTDNSDETTNFALTPRYELISLKAETFINKLIMHIRVQHGMTSIKKNDRSSALYTLWYEGANIFKDFGIRDSSSFYKRWGRSISYDSASSMLKMEFPISDSTIEVPTELVFNIFPKN